MRYAISVLAVALQLFATASCEHSEPFRPDDREPLEPFGSLRLTFNPSDDRDPSIMGDQLIFSRLDPLRADGDRCVAFMPVEGGTIRRTLCHGGDTPDTVRHARLRPRVSPDGSLLAFVEEESNAAVTSPRAPQRRSLIVISLDSLTEIADLNPSRVQGATGVVNDMRDIEWVSSSRVRFLAGEGGFNSLTNDTTFVGRALVDYDVRTDAVEIVSRLDSVVSVVTASEGIVWAIAKDSVTIVRLSTDGARDTLQIDWDLASLVPGVSRSVRRVGSRIALISRVLPDPVRGFTNRVLLFDAVDGTFRGTLWDGNEPRGITSGNGGAPVVLEIADSDDGDLWLVEL